jgi:alcohol dehydrogenase class IV
MSLITYLTRIHFADRVLEDALGEEAAKLGLRRPAVVCDAAAEAGDALDRVFDALPRCATPVGPRRAPLRLTLAALAREAEFWAGAGCDGAIGVGGPAALDLARALGRAGPERAGAGVPAAAPVVAIPTTTASVGLGPLAPALGATADARLPTLILCDPTLTLAAGPAETAAAGMDALVHCLEAWLGGAWNPPADGIALDGLRRAGRWLARAVEDGRDLAARRELLAAALDAGLAAEKGLGGVRALAHALEDEARLGTPHGTPHGALHAALVRPVLAFNAPAVSDRLEGAREALDLPSGVEPGEALAALGARLGLPGRLGGLGLQDATLRRVARRAAEDPATLTNPRHATAADYLAMLEAAL